jgi:hypothetical protein
MADIVKEIVTLSGHTTRAVVRLARKGTIKKCRLVQWDDDEGLFDGFRYSFWAAKEACPPLLVANDDPRLPRDDWDRVEYQVGDAREVAKGADELKDAEGKPDTKVEWEYKNRDNGGSQTNMLRQIYLELRDDGPTDDKRVKRYKLFLTVEPKTD